MYTRYSNLYAKLLSYYYNQSGRYNCYMYIIMLFIMQSGKQYMYLHVYENVNGSTSCEAL